MQLTIQKWGNSAAVRLPTTVLSQAGLSIGDAVDANAARGVVTLVVSKPKYKLADLVAEMPDGLPMVAGWDEMAPVGNEAI